MESIVSLIAFIYLFQMGKSQMETKAKERAQRMEMLEKALANPNLDRATVQLLAQQLTGAKSPKGGRGNGLAWLLALGWLALFSGIGIYVLGIIQRHSESQSAGLLVALIGFGLITYPFALRELESRRPAA
jgi:hypothetical protein